MPESARDIALNVLRRLREAGFEAYFAGGCVRDLLMGQTPKDYDVATNAAPEQVRRLFKNTQAVGAAFGVILVRQGTSVIEVATFRTDLEYQDGRHPTGVTFSTAQEDAQRRDFTINGLFLDPLDNRIIDYVDGQADLQAKQLRAIGDASERFNEDHLRMLRAVRFASRLGFEIEAKTFAAIRTHAEAIIRISPERIADELRKMLAPPTRAQAHGLLISTGLLSRLMRFVREDGPGPMSETVNLFSAVDPTHSISFGLALASMSLDFQINTTGVRDLAAWLTPARIKRTANDMRKTLKISNDESAEMTGSMSFIHLLGDIPPSVATLKRFLNQPHSEGATLLMSALATCDLISEKIRPVLASLNYWRLTDFAPTPLITGDDLTAAGAAPGPRFKHALDAAYDAQLEDRISTREQALEMAIAIAKKL